MDPIEHILSITFRKEDLLPHRHLFKRKAKSIGWPTGTPQYACLCGRPAATGIPYDVNNTF